MRKKSRKENQRKTNCGTNSNKLKGSTITNFGFSGEGSVLVLQGDVTFLTVFEGPFAFYWVAAILLGFYNMGPFTRNRISVEL